MRRRLIRPGLRSVAALLLVSGLIAAGCGDDDDEPSTTTSAPATGVTGTEGVAGDELLIVEVDELCKAAETETDLAAEGLDPNDPQDQEEIADVLVPIGQGLVDAILATEGVEDNPEITAYADSVQESVDELEADPSVIANPDFAAESDDLASEAGLVECAD